MKPRAKRSVVAIWACIALVAAGIWLWSVLQDRATHRKNMLARECAGRLDHLARDLVDYAKSHEGRYPLTLLAVIATKDEVLHHPARLICPDGQEHYVSGADVNEIRANFDPARHSSYYYFGAGRTVDQMRGRPILLEKRPNHLPPRGRWYVCIGQSENVNTQIVLELVSENEADKILGDAAERPLP